METLKVSSKSNPNNVAGAIANILKDEDKVTIQVIGAGALNQLIKSIIICKGFLAPIGKKIICDPSFTDVVIDNEEKTAIKMSIEVRWFYKKNKIFDIFLFLWYNTNTSRKLGL